MSFTFTLAISISSAKLLHRDTWGPARFVAPGFIGEAGKTFYILGAAILSETSIAGEEFAMTELVAGTTWVRPKPKYDVI